MMTSTKQKQPKINTVLNQYKEQSSKTHDGYRGIKPIQTTVTQNK